jgi:hypothetical protein
VELLADHRSRLDDAPAAGLESLQPHLQQGVDGGRDGRSPAAVDVGHVEPERPPSVHGVEQVLVAEVGDQLLDDQRVSLGPLGDERLHLRAVLGLPPGGARRGPAAVSGPAVLWSTEGVRRRPQAHQPGAGAGYDSVFEPVARAATEVPTTLRRFVRQQLRWNRSFYREL